MTEQTPTPTDLQARIARLEAENLELRSRVAAPSVDGAAPARGPRGTRRSRPGWAVLSVCLIIIGSILAPLAVVTVWARSTLVDTDRFVATYAPLADDRAIQDYVIDQTVTVIDQNADIDRLTADLIDGIKQLGTGPRASAALDALQGPAARGVQSLIRSGVTTFVRSDAFAQAWERALRVSHTQLMATVSGDPDAILAAQQDGTIGIQLGPIVEEIKQFLVGRGIDLAARIPTVNRTIPVAEADQIGAVRAGYRTVLALGTWLPWVCLLFLAAGVLTARRWSRGLVGAGVGFAVAMLILLLGFFVGRTLLATSLPPSLVPSNVSDLLYNRATEAMRDTAVAGLVLGLAVAAVAWFAGPFGASEQIRRGYGGAVHALRRSAGERGITTGRVGEWLFRRRILIRVLIGVIAAVIIIFSRPLAVSVVVITALVAIAVLIVISLVERPPESTVDAQPL